MLASTVFWFAYVTAYSLGADQYSAWGGNNPAGKGVETRIVEISGPNTTSEAECKAYADGRRKAVAKTLGLPDYRLLKFVCVPITLPTK